jgi:hypothetical protein
LTRDKARLDWLSLYGTERLQDVRWHIENEGGDVRDAIDWFMKRDTSLAEVQDAGGNG